MGLNADENNTRHKSNLRIASIAGGGIGTLTVNGVGARDILTSVTATTEGDISNTTTITGANEITTTVDTTGETVIVAWYAQA